MSYTFRTLSKKHGPSEVKFWQYSGAYGQLCNYWGKHNDSRFKLIIDDVEWSSTEHYFQAMKFLPHNATEDQKSYAEVIRGYTDPHMAKTLANQRIAKDNHVWHKECNEIISLYLQRGLRIRPDWESVKDGIMLEALRAKFSQNQHLRSMLLATGEAKIYEASPIDSYWGIGKDKKGKNRLGLLLEQVRGELQTM